MNEDPRPLMDLSDVAPHRMAEALSDLSEYEQAQQAADGVAAAPTQQKDQP